MSICVAQDCANEGWAAEPVLGAAFCYGHWDKAKAALAKGHYTRKDKYPYSGSGAESALKVYFLISDKYIKIGSSKHPLERLKAFRTGFEGSDQPADLDRQNIECAGWYYGSRREEMRLHKRFAAHRATGEWFIKSKDLELEVRKEMHIHRRAAA